MKVLDNLISKVLASKIDETNVQLKRIADAFDRFILEEYAVPMSPPVVDTSGPPPETIEWDDEFEAVRDTLIETGFLDGTEDEEELDQIKKDMKIQL